MTVLFADLVGFTGRSETLDPEDVEAILRPYHERLRDELERRGGTVEKFIGDAVMAVFGAPVSHEDDPERAVRAAIAIRDWARESDGLQVRIGVNTGEALVNLDARAAAGEGMVAGDVVNTAARLQSAAPTNGILVGEHAYNATKHVVEYRAAEGVEAKGKAEPVHVWEAVQARSRFGVDVRQWSRAPLVGRERERTLLVETLKRVRSGRSPQLVTLVGVPGIGKSRLVYELFQSIERGDELIAWRQGRSLPYGEGVPFWAFAELTKAHAGILEDDAPDAAVGKLEAAVESIIPEAERDWVAGQLRPLVGLEADGDTGADRRTESFAAWRRFVEGVAEQRPLVLVFDDLHWADEGLLDFIDHLVEWAVGVPLLVVCTARPELFERRPGWGGGKLNALTLALSPLEEADAARLIASVLEQAVLPAATQRALLDRAGGNPLYAEQYARLYVERGPGADLPLPESVHGLIAARVDALPLAEKALLQDAAVMGKIFWSGALGGNGALPERLHSLERKDFIRRERQSSVAGELEYAFRHVLVRDVAYGQIPGRSGRRSTAPQPSGSRRSAGRRTTRSSSPTTTSRRWSSREQPDRSRTGSLRGPRRRRSTPRPAPSRSTRTRLRPSGTSERLTSIPRAPIGHSSCSGSRTRATCSARLALRTRSRRRATRSSSPETLRPRRKRKRCSQSSGGIVGSATSRTATSTRRSSSRAAPARSPRRRACSRRWRASACSPARTRTGSASGARLWPWRSRSICRNSSRAPSRPSGPRASTAASTAQSKI